MALSQRPASRFFAAFYRWNLHNQRPRSCALASECARNLTHRRNSSTPRNYHATRLLLHDSQPQSQEQGEDTSAVGENARGISGRGGERIFRPSDAAQEEGATKQPDVDEQDTSLEPTESDLEAEKLKASVRGLMRKVPSSVAVLTVAGIDPDTQEKIPMGVAVSSLSTVTLDPPTISFNIKEPSKTLDAIRAANGLFRVHFPAADRGGAKVVELFCRGNHADAWSLRSKELKLNLQRDKKNPAATLSLAPQIWDDFILGAMECEITHELPVADHVILVAKIYSMEHKTSKEPTIMYIDGGYRKPQAEGIYPSGRTKSLTAGEDIWSVWDSPLFPGAKERQRYLQQIKTIIKGSPAYYESPSRETYRSLELHLPYAAGNFGINLGPLVAECRKEMGLKDELKAQIEGQDILSDFYGPLTPSMKEQIIARAKKLIKMDSMFLSQNYRVFLHNLGVSSNSRNFLPSDIMGPLRAEGLVPAFEPRRGHSESLTYDIRKLEQVEHHLREHLRKMKYEVALKESFERTMEAIGERKVAAFYFKKARSRLLTQSHPTCFDAQSIDIAGEVTQEELLVVLCRFINRLRVHSQTEFRTHINTDWCETLRRVGVNPTISGMDVEFLAGKLKHMYYSTRQFRDFPAKVDKMLEPFFVWNISWDDLEERVKKFVTNMPLRAIAWEGRDQLAAMGLHWEATVTLPKQDALDEEVRQSLSQGSILATLVAKELKSLHGKGPEEVNQAIAKYLKEEYDFDITHKPITYTPAAEPELSSGDEMQQAMMATLGAAQHQTWSAPVEPPQDNRSDSGSNQRSDKSMKFLHERQRDPHQDIKGPRIRFRQAYTIGKSGHTVQQVPGRVRDIVATKQMKGKRPVFHNPPGHHGERHQLRREWRSYDFDGKGKD